MRFKHTPTSPIAPGTRRTIKRFAIIPNLLPVLNNKNDRVGKVWVWLERYFVVQRRGFYDSWFDEYEYTRIKGAVTKDASDQPSQGEAP